MEAKHEFSDELFNLLQAFANDRENYLRAALAISNEAVGNPDSSSHLEAVYKISTFLIRLDAALKNKL